MNRRTLLKALAALPFAALPFAGLLAKRGGAGEEDDTLVVTCPLCRRMSQFSMQRTDDFTCACGGYTIAAGAWYCEDAMLERAMRARIEGDYTLLPRGQGIPPSSDPWLFNAIYRRPR